MEKSAYLLKNLKKNLVPRSLTAILNQYLNHMIYFSEKVLSQPPPQALRFSHGRGERETSDW